MSSRAFRRSLSDFRRHPWLHLVSVSTITVALLILGGFFLCYRNFEALSEKADPHITGTIYLKDGLQEGQLAALKAHLGILPKVQSVVYKTKTSVLEDLQSFLGGSANDNLPGSDLFPDILEMELASDTAAATLSSMKADISHYPEVTEVDFSDSWLAQYQKIHQMLRVFGFCLLAGILVGCSFIIANFMGMRHQARKHEIDIVRLIGGHRSFVLSPFLWEGLIEGILGAGIALVLLYFFKVLVTTLITVQWHSLLGIQEWLFLSPAQLTCLLSMGILMAFCGSITVFMRFQENNFR